MKKKQVMTKEDCETIGKDVKGYLFEWNKNFTKIRRKKSETDGHFLKRIIEGRDKYLKKLSEECKVIESKNKIEERL